MRVSLVLGTRNRKKREEIVEILGDWSWTSAT